jgi:RNA polymerase sigma-70 factor (ECF subfamily)
LYSARSITHSPVEEEGKNKGLDAGKIMDLTQHQRRVVVRQRAGCDYNVTRTESGTGVHPVSRGNAVKSFSGILGAVVKQHFAAPVGNADRQSGREFQRRRSSVMSENDSFALLMIRLRSGEDGAAREVFVRFASRLAGLARRHLDARLAVKVDPEDVVQSAYKSFFIRQREGELEIGTWDGLWGLLTMITLRKCADRAAYYRADKRDVTRETAGSDDSSPAMVNLAFDREPQPDEAAALAETVESLFRSIDDADERAILELSLQGYTATEISEKLGRAERSVRRLREHIRKRLERMQIEAK